MQDRLSITRGADRSFVIRLKNRRTGDPLDLTTVTNVQISLTNNDRTDLILNKITVPATRASGKKDNITITAVNSGMIGNAVYLNFNGTDTIDAIITAWNSANQNNNVSYSGLGSVIPTVGTLQLSGGYGSYDPVSIHGNPVLGKVMVRMLEKETLNLKTGTNQSMKIVIDDGINPGGQRIITYYENKVDVIWSA